MPESVGPRKRVRYDGRVEFREGATAPVLPQYDMMRVQAGEIRRLRATLGVSLSKLAERVGGVGAPIICMIENERREMYIKQSLAERLAAVLLDDAERWRDLVDERDTANALGAAYRERERASA